MAMGKRQLVLAALVVALGAAVYLNVVLSGNSASLKATQAVASNTGRQLGQTLMVNGSAPSAKSSASSAKSQSAASSSAAKQTEANTSTDDFFTQAALSRQKAQDEAKETFAKILEDTSKSDAAHKEAVDKAAKMTENLLKQANIETLIKAKGYSDCIVTLGEDQCSVIVKTKENSQNDAIVIQDIVASQTGLSFDKIHIIERT
ncbi:MAG: Sporulation protein [Thermocaproicibacter melissae]|jgi:stage III sporulation protein AH|uniref:SpoIIIAH-like family protein n=1 Tax=Thermocaproicibacter melissae TaxID=2966552 RepID=UPI0024B17F44|nr:SpoIIIAH-like family protein [Thermocaproicibacter melissae]WBY64821.1 SpoIIIAH-like family protein [Thermocaproicibacter melissae]